MTPTDRHAADEQRWSAWMAQAQRGDPLAYEQLLRELGRAIEAYLRVRFGRIDLIEDCVQESLLCIHQARHTYDPRRPFRPWMLTLVRHKTIDLLRRRQNWVDVRQAATAAVQGADDPQRLARLIDGIRILDQLDPDHREVITLAKYAGYTTAEAAQWLGISESAVKARLHRALRSVARYLEGEGENLCLVDATS